MNCRRMRIQIEIVLYITVLVSASTHTPQVYEDNYENHVIPEGQGTRSTRDSDGKQTVFYPPVFNYQMAPQQDRLRSRYHRQQQSDFRMLKKTPMNPDLFFELHQFLAENRGTPMNIHSAGDNWKPFYPQEVLTAAKSQNKKGQRQNVNEKKSEDIENLLVNDLDAAGSEVDEQKVKTDRQDQNSRYIYIQPSILKNNFGLDSEAAKQILKNSAPPFETPNKDQFQISELQQLLGKQPNIQLEGLQKLLEQSHPIIKTHLPIPEQLQKDLSGIKIEHNGSPVLNGNIPKLDELQKQFDAVSKSQADAAFAEAEKQAAAHVEAQHKAIALAQQQAQEAAYAKIAAHNNGVSTLSLSEGLDLPQAALVQVTAAPLIGQHAQAYSTPKPLQVAYLQQNSLDFQHLNNEILAESSPAKSTANIAGPQTLALRANPHEFIPQSGQRNKMYAPSFLEQSENKPGNGIHRGRTYQQISVGKILSRPQNLQALASVPSYSQVSAEIPSLAQESNFVPQQEFVPDSSKADLIGSLNLQGHKHESFQEVNLDTTHGGEHNIYHEENNNNDDLHQYAAKYAFGYRIVDVEHGNDYGHEEERNGKHTKGHYFVHLPDGRIQKVEYFVDNSGYHAKVSYENVGQHPHPQHDHGFESGEH